MNIKTKMGLEKFITEVYENAKKHGWHQEKREVGTTIALMHSELSEALEFARNEIQLNKKGINALFHYSGTDERGKEVLSNEITLFTKKPDGYLVELADVVIRIFDEVGSKGLATEFIEKLLEKHEYNKTREFKHGNKRF